MSAGSHSKIEKIHLGTQILAQVTTIVAAIVLAIWAYYSTIYVKKEKEVTEYTLKELDQKTTQKPHIQAKVESTVQPLVDGKNLLLVRVILSNIGSKESRVTLDDNALVLVPVAFTEGAPVYKAPISLQSGRYGGTPARIPLNFVDVGAGESYEITFAHKLEKSGVYLVHFLALNGVNPPATDQSIASFIPYQYAIGVDEYVVVN